MGWTVYDSSGNLLSSIALVDNVVATAKIADDAVTYAKMQNLGTADRVLGSTSTGVIGEVQIVADMLATDAVTNVKVATGLDAVKLADGSVTNAELQYINTLSSNAQTQIALKAPIATPTFTTSITIGSATVTEAQLEILDGATVTTAELNLLDGVAGLVQADLTKLAAIDSTAAEINLLDALDRGSILYGNPSGVTTVLGQGTTDQILTSDGTDISWEDAAGGGPSQATKAHIQDRTNQDTYIPPDLLGYHHGVAKAWGQAGDTGVLASPYFNLTSMGHTSTGIFLITFAEDFDDKDLSGGFQGRDNHGFAITTGEGISDVGKIRIRTYTNDGTLADRAIGFVFFGTQ